MRQNLSYYRRVLGAPASDVDRAIERTDLGSVADRLAGSLSGGQRGRVSLAAALLGSPEVLVLDEPTVGLDPVLRVELWGPFHELAAGGTSLLGGIFLPRDQLPEGLEAISDWLPLSFAIDALQAVAGDTEDAAWIWSKVLVIGAWIIGSIVVGSITLRRRTP